MTRRFAVAYDYRCPFARNAHEHVLDGLAAGADWDVGWLPFSLAQSKEETWDRAQDPSLYAFEMSIIIRDAQPDVFPVAHRALFALRHDLAGDLRDPDVVDAAMESAGVDVDAARKALATGAPLETLRDEHRAAVKEHDVWGVPTFVMADQVAFVRLMERPATSNRSPIETIEGVLDLLTGWVELNEFKHTTISR